MRSTPDKPDLTLLNDTYDILGEIGTREHSASYVGTRKVDACDVLITVMRANAEVADGKAIAQFAADANLLVTLTHPNVPRVIEGRWIGDDCFAMVSERVQGTTLAELLKGERLPNPRIADILGDVDGVLEWARGERIAHRGVTPDGVWLERGTGKVFILLSPTDVARTNQPDDYDDARTVGALALTMLTSKPAASDHDGTLGSQRPDLPQRVIDATLTLANSTTNDVEPNVSAYLASLAMADAIKEGELEVARVDADFRAAMQGERERWEAEQLAAELAAEAQAKLFAEERAEYERRTAKEREQLESARAEIDKRRTEVQQARVELDLARAEFKERKSALDARVKEIDRHAHGLEKQQRELHKLTAELERKNRTLEAATAIGAAETSMAGLKSRLTVPLAGLDDDGPQTVEVTEMAGGIESVEDVHQPWTPIEEVDPWAIPLQTDEPASAMQYEAAAVPPPQAIGRSWTAPAAIVGLVSVLVVAALVVNQHVGGRATTTVANGPTARMLAVPDTAAMPASPVLETADSAGGEVVPTLSDTAEFTVLRDSIDRADERLAARRAKAAAIKADSAARADSVKRRDTTTVRRDTLVRPDTGR